MDVDREEEMTGGHSISRRSLLHGAGATIAFCATPSWAQRPARWPDHPVRLIVPYPAGGSTDVLFRVLAERLQDKLGQPFVVENRAGASGNVGNPRPARVLQLP
jgi:tripartite-type tricarboxylate transporter receptor subunit TctC